MVTNNQQKKHRQFGLKLLFVAIIVALVFTVWYISQKHERAIQEPALPNTNTAIEVESE